MAAHVLGDAEPPPDLLEALNYRAWGVGDLGNLPAGLLYRMNRYLNVYNAITGWKHAAPHTVEWTRRNPEQWEIAARVIAAYKGVKGG